MEKKTLSEAQAQRGKNQSRIESTRASELATDEIRDAQKKIDRRSKKTAMEK